MIEVVYTTQYCQDGYEINGGLYADADADMVRYWAGEFCLVEMTRVTPSLWEPTGGDSLGWTDLADSYAEPIDALRELLPATEYTLVDADA